MELVFVQSVLTIIFLCIFPGQCTEDVNYYWRDYAGFIPKDAVPGGYDINHNVTYIGQVHAKDYGILPAMIYPGQKYVIAPEAAPKRIYLYIKILCSPNLPALKWLPADTNNFHLLTINKNLVVGGMEDKYLLFIGRISYQGEVVVGKVVTDAPRTPREAILYFVNNNAEKFQHSFEVLIYDESLDKNIEVRTAGQCT